MKDEKPFVVGNIADSFRFTNRVKEQIWLNNRYLNGVNVTLISPRRYGKSSLVRFTANKILKEEKDYIFCFIDLFNIKSEQEFYTQYLEAFVNAIKGKWESKVKEVFGYFKYLIPSFTYQASDDTKLAVKLDWETSKKSADEILDVPEKYAQAKGKKIIYCLDEFQNIGFFDEPVAFQKKLRSHWQLHKNVSYCMYGSKRHMMVEFFNSSSMPFYRFGEIMFLDKIHESDWLPFITSQFERTKKSISTEEAALIAQNAENHPFYVQQLALNVWFNTARKCSIDIIETSLNDLLIQNSILYQRDMDQITSLQANLLKAICFGEERLTTAEVIKRYKLRSSANVITTRKALETKELIDGVNGTYQILDPLFKRWLKDVYFHK